MIPNVLCIRLTSAFYKIVFSFTKQFNGTSKSISEFELKNVLTENFTYSILWWIYYFKEQSFNVTEVELVIPPLGAYLNLEESIKEILLQSGVLFSVSTGIMLDIPGTNINDNIGYIKAQIQELRKKDIGQN